MRLFDSAQRDKRHGLMRSNGQDVVFRIDLNLRRSDFNINRSVLLADVIKDKAMHCRDMQTGILDALPLPKHALIRDFV